MAYDIRMGGNVGTVATVFDVDEIPVPVGYDYWAITIGCYRFGPDDMEALDDAIAQAKIEAAKREGGS